MPTLSSSDPFLSRRPSFLLNTLWLIGIMLLYPLVGVLLFSLVSGGTDKLSLLHPLRSQIPSMRLLQAVGQILVLALPVLLLAGWHTGRKNPFASESLAFLGIQRGVDFGSLFLAVAGIFLLQPLLQTLTALQDIYLWPALGDAGREVVRQRYLMESFISEIAQVGSFEEFLSVAFVLALTPAVCEELFFRGYIQQNYTRSLSSGGAVLLTGSVFAFFHLSAANLLPLALLGWYIGYIYSKTGNLLVPSLAHLANNLAALTFLLFSEGGKLKGVDDFRFLLSTVWWWLVVAGSLFLFVFIIRRFSLIPSVKKGWQVRSRNGNEVD